MKRLIQNGTIVTCAKNTPRVFAHHDIVIEDHLISAVAPTGTFRADRFDETIDAGQHVVIPGLINTHHHLYQTLTRCHPAVQNAKLFTWLTELYKRWQYVDYQAIKTAAQVSIAELLLSGCTTTVDHFYLFPQKTNVRLEAVLEAADELGIRIHACRGSMTLGQSAGGLPPDVCVEKDDDVLKDCRRVVERYHDASTAGMRKIDLAPCAPFNVSHELFVETAKLARSLRVLLHTHAAETADEEAYCRKRFGKRPIEYLQDCGWLGSDVYLAHCVCLNEEDIRVLAKTRTGVAHCPCSNMRLGSGIAPIVSLLRAGVNVGLAVDGSSSNDGGNLLAEARQALLLQRVQNGADAMTVADAFTMATVGGARCLNRNLLGRIEPGCCADLVLYRKDGINWAGAIAQDPLGALMLCQSPRPDQVIVNGKIVVQDGRLATADENRLSAQLNQIVSERFST